MLAAAYRALSETNAERELLDRSVQQDDEANDAYLRLAELARQRANGLGSCLNAQRSLAVDPLASAPYGFLATASGHLDDLKHAIQANRALLQLDPPNPAEVHFQLAEALRPIRRSARATPSLFRRSKKRLGFDSSTIASRAAGFACCRHDNSATPASSHEKNSPDPDVPRGGCRRRLGSEVGQVAMGPGRRGHRDRLH